MSLKAKASRREHPEKLLALDEATREETHRLNADIPVSLYDQLRRHVASLPVGTTIKDITIQSLEEYLSKYSSK